jgi:hypothetical protein
VRGFPLKTLGFLLAKVIGSAFLYLFFKVVKGIGPKKEAP